jgi:hypothetical protein
VTIGGCNPMPVFSAPGDNRCASFGGCAVPISASQVFPKSGSMQLYQFVWDLQQKKWTSTPVGGGTFPFETGQNVHDVAWKAYFTVMDPDNKNPPDPPKATPLRLAFPPST